MPTRSADAVSRYAYSVIDGLTVAGRLVRLACERHVRDMETGAARGLRFNSELAARAIAFYGFLKHSKGEWAGKPLTLEPWQQFIVGSLFGWQRQEHDAAGALTGAWIRRFTTAYDEIARKNGKSTLAAGIGLELFVFDGEQGAEVYCAATKKDQARIVWDEAARMARRSPALAKRIKAYKNNLNIPGTASKMEPLGADEDTLDGLNTHAAIIDEVHAHKKRTVVDVLETSTGARRQPLIFYITTAGYDRSSVCWELHEHGVKVLEGAIEDDQYFAYIAAIDELDDWTDEKVWAKANPNLGVSVKLDDLRAQAKRAQQIPGMQNGFLRLRMDVWTQQSTKWLDTDVWAASAGKAFTLEEMKGRTCYVGIDLSSTTDLASACYLFPPTGNENEEQCYRAFWRFWLPASALDAKRSKRGHRELEMIRRWAGDGFIQTTPGNVADYDFIREQILKDTEGLDVRELGYDPWNATQLALQLQGEGLLVVPVRQGFASLSEPSKLLASLLLEQQFVHGGNPVATWMASNVAIREDPAGNLKPDKGGSADRIDGIAAAIIALARAMLDQGAPKTGWLVATIARPA